MEEIKILRIMISVSIIKAAFRNKILVTSFLMYNTIPIILDIVEYIV